MAPSDQNTDAEPYQSKADQSINWLHAHATPLGPFIDNLARSIPSPTESAIGAPSETDKTLAAFFARSPGDQQRESKMRDGAVATAFRDLESGDLQAYGCIDTADGLPEPRSIPPAFWIKARTYYNFSVARLGDREFTDIRVRRIEMPLRSDTRDVAQESPLRPDAADLRPLKGESVRKQGRPSNKLEIMTAIENCATPKNWFSANGPEAREKAYRDSVKATFGINTRTDPGFETKTFQKYETKFRRKTNR